MRGRHRDFPCPPTLLRPTHSLPSAPHRGCTCYVELTGPALMRHHTQAPYIRVLSAVPSVACTAAVTHSHLIVTGEFHRVKQFLQLKAGCCLTVKVETQLNWTQWCRHGAASHMPASRKQGSGGVCSGLREHCPQSAGLGVCERLAPWLGTGRVLSKGRPAGSSWSWAVHNVCP